MGNRSVYGGGRRNVKKEAEKQMVSMVVDGLNYCHGPSAPSRKRRGSPVGMTWCGACDQGLERGVGVTGWGNARGSSIDGGGRGG
jgi:hypothetical protein